MSDMLKTYFDVFSKYLDEAGITMSYTEFANEVHERWPTMILFMVMLLPIVLNPEERDAFRTAKAMKEFYAFRDEMLSAPNKPDDHPQILEIRRRLVDIVEEGYEFGFIK